MAEDSDIRWADLVVIVKRADGGLVERIHRAGKPLVLDILDAWPQPTNNWLDRAEAISQMRSTIATFRPRAVVFATQQMRDDIAFEGPSIALKHHGRPGIQRNPIRREVQTVCFEGCKRYLEDWKDILIRCCKARGWDFRINPNQLADADIVVAFRGEKYSGYQSSHWKSGVKLSNAQASGTPCIIAPECGYLEQSSGAEYWARTESDLQFGLNWLTEYEARKAASERLLQFAPKLEDIAETYKKFLRRLA